MASVNAWRFKLAEEEEKRRRQLGFKDIMDLLMTGFQAYQGVQGIKQGREGLDLRREQIDRQTANDAYGQEQDALARARQAEIDARTQEAHEVGMHNQGYFTPEGEGPMPATAQTTTSGMTRLPLYDEAREDRSQVEDWQRTFDILKANAPEGAVVMPTTEGGRAQYPPDYGRGAGAPDTISPNKFFDALERNALGPMDSAPAYSLEGVPMYGTAPETSYGRPGQNIPVIETPGGPMLHMPQPGVPEETPFDSGKAMQLLGFTANPRDPYQFYQMPGLLEGSNAILQSGGQVPWDNDDVMMTAQDLNARPPMATPDEIVRDAEKLYGPGWGIVFLQTVQAMGR